MGIKNEIIMDESVFIADTATVTGKVKFGKNSSVWFSAVVRGDYEEIEIGEGSNIQDCAVVHTDHDLPTYIGDYVVIGHSAIVHGAKIGNNVLIAMGAIVLNGAEIGDNCIVGAGAVVKEYSKIPANSLYLGVPAKFAKKIDEETAKKITDNADDYIKLSRKYLEGYKSVNR